MSDIDPNGAGLVQEHLDTLTGLLNRVGVEACLASQERISPPPVLGALAVGPGQRIVTVQVQRNEQTTCLVLGVTAHNIQCLHVLGESAQSASLTPETITPSAQSATHFAQTLVAEQGKDS